MRGCFLLPIIPNKTIWAFPAYAGMFLKRSTLKALLMSFPRVCGDVSSFGSYSSIGLWLSPRMRGCFRAWTRCIQECAAFPAYAGMFLRKFHLRVLQSGFPRVCGDVSVRADLTYQQGLLSPRMRGCFLSCNSDARRFPAFPAYAGMFLIPERLILNIRGFPRVCGDVSSGTTITNEIRELSPRMRGCFL